MLTRHIRHLKNHRTLKTIGCVLLLIMLLPHPVLAQADTEWEQLMQEMADEEGVDEEAWQGQADWLNDLHEHPIDINTATKEQLLALPFLDDEQAEGIVNYVAHYGPLRSLGELRLIGPLSPEQARWLRMFISLEPIDERPHFTKPNRHELFTRIGIPLYHRDGWPWARGISHRWRYTGQVGNHWDFGMKGERDEGEPMLSRHVGLWDSWGAHVMLTDVGPLQRLIVGDYKVGFGEGLVVNNDFRLGKLTTGLWRTPGGIRPHRSADEARYMRGVAATLSVCKNITLTGFYSWRKLDGTIGTDNSVSTISTTGLHRTESELSRRGNLTSHTTGVHVGWQQGPWRAGATANYQYYDHIFVRGKALYRQIYPQGYQFGAISADYAYKHSPLYISGETARSFDNSGGGWATLNKVAWRFSNMQLATIQRYFSYRYYAPNASAFGEGDRVQNESGIALLLETERIGAFRWRAFADLFYSPWPRYSMSHSSMGWEGMVQTTWQPDRKNSLLIRYQLKSKEQSDQRYLRHQLRTTYIHSISPQWTAQGSLFVRHYSEVATNNNAFGWALVPQVAYTSADEQWRWTLMAAWFDAQEYEARIFLYEPSLYQTFGLQQLYGRGERVAATLRWQSSNRRLHLQTKLGLTHREDRAEFSSGPTHIASPWKADLQVLVRWKI